MRSRAAVVVGRKARALDQMAGLELMGVDRDADAEAIVRAAIALARSLGLRVTAEEVETTAQFDSSRPRAAEA